MRALQPIEIDVELIETKLDDTQIPQSNVTLFNGVPIEDIPAKAIRQAALKVLGIEVTKKTSGGNCDCGCNNSGCC